MQTYETPAENLDLDKWHSTPSRKQKMMYWSPIYRLWVFKKKSYVTYNLYLYSHWWWYQTCSCYFSQTQFHPGNAVAVWDGNTDRPCWGSTSCTLQQLSVSEIRQLVKCLRCILIDNVNYEEMWHIWKPTLSPLQAKQKQKNKKAFPPSSVKFPSWQGFPAFFMYSISKIATVHPSKSKVYKQGDCQFAYFFQGRWCTTLFVW